MSEYEYLHDDLAEIQNRMEEHNQILAADNAAREILATKMLEIITHAASRIGVGQEEIESLEARVIGALNGLLGQMEAWERKGAGIEKAVCDWATTASDQAKTIVALQEGIEQLDGRLNVACDDIKALSVLQSEIARRLAAHETVSLGEGGDGIGH
jgi:chromosome segregation ATPase